MHVSVVGRLAAAAVAMVLTGAPALVARDEERAHRCSCKGHSELRECDCVRCHARDRVDALDGATLASAHPARHGAAEAAQPRCHPSRATKTHEAPPARRPDPTSGPCVAGVCGFPDAPAACLAGVDRFTLVETAAPPPQRDEAVVLERAGRFLFAPSAPEAPHPRGA
jgi:hypothetical protein